MKMNKVILIIVTGIFSIVIFAFGFATGNYLHDYDVLCEKGFSVHKLKKEFKSQEGILLPAGTIVYARGCKPNTDVRLEFFIDNWNYKNLEKLEGNPFPAYYLDAEDDEQKI
jgi:hypothetical protein